MRKRERKIGMALLMVSCMVGNLLVPAAASESGSEGTCGVCGLTFTDGFCMTDLLSEGGLDVPELTVNPDLGGVSSYAIENAGQLAWFAKGVNSNTLQTQNAHLTADIDWTSISMYLKWEPIGSYIESVSEVPYQGTFDGNGYVISNVVIEDKLDGSIPALFGEIGNGAKVMELGLETISVKSQAARTAVLAGNNLGQIADCYILDSTVTVSASEVTAADIASINNGSITNCFSDTVFKAGTLADGTTASYYVMPIFGENRMAADAIKNNYYLEQIQENGKEPTVTVLEQADSVTAEEYKSGSVAYDLNNGRTPAVFGQDLALQPDGTLKELGLIRYYETDDTGAYVTDGEPLYKVTLDYAAAETADYSFYSNEVLAFANLPVGFTWQMTDAAGALVPVTGDVALTADVTLTELVVVQKAQATLQITPNPMTDDDAPIDHTDFVVTGNEGGAAVQLSFFAADGVTPIGAPADPGTYYVVAAVAETENYLGVQTAMVPFTINEYVCPHSFTVYSMVSSATCGANAVESANCDLGCGAVDQREVANSIVGHSYTQYADSAAATCVSNARQIAYCDYGCGNYSEIEVADSMLQHSFTNFTEIAAATCVSNARQSAACDYGCGNVQEREVEGTAGTGSHSFTNYVDSAAATCQTNARQSAVCDYGCGAVDEREVEGTIVGHSFTNYQETVAATCQTPARQSAVCDYGCGTADERDVEGSQVPHSFTSYAVSAAATCTSNAKESASCDYGCGTADEREVEGSQLAHSFTSYAVSVPATCTSNAKESASCDHGCGAIDEREAADSQLAHSFTNYTQIAAATCSGNAKESAVCDYGCGTADEREVEGSQLSHSFTSYTVTAAATCSSNARETASCDYGCGLTDEREVEGSQLTHSFTSYAVTTAATCNGNARETAVCDHGCGLTDEREVEGSQLAHSFTSYAVTTAATCNSNARETASCDHGCGLTDEREVANSQLVHSFTSYAVTVPATCQSNAKESASCDHGCGAVDEREVANSVTGHSFSNYAVTSAATCQANAVETAVCDYGCQTTDVREVADSKLAHSFTSYTITTEATCQTNARETAVCDHGCGTTDEREIANSTVPHSFPAVEATVSDGEITLSHDYLAELVSAATCQKNMVIRISCEYGCGSTQEVEVQGTMVDHKYGVYTLSAEATCQTNAKESAACEYNCGTVDEREIPDTRVDHTFGEYVETAPATCQTNAKEAAACTFNCGTVDEREVAESILDHSFVNGICTSCGASDSTFIGSDVAAEAAETNKGNNGWYRGAVTLNAPAGCMIAAEADDEFAASVTFELVSGANSLTYYLRRENGEPVVRTMTVNADLTAPTAAMTVGSMTANAPTDEITFEKFFNAFQTMSIFAQDGNSGIASIEYVITSDVMNETEMQNAQWVTYLSAPVSLDWEGNFVLYARVTDKAGNVTMVNTNGFVIDVTSPVVEGVTAGSAYCPNREITVSEANGIASVMLNQAQAVLTEGKLTIGTPGAYTLVVTDLAGNQTSVSFQINTDHVWDLGQISEPATCTREGVKLFTCTVCQGTKTEAIPMIPHKYTNYIYNNDATCIANGTKSAACDYGCGTKDTIEAEGTMKGHSFTNYVYNKDASCQKDGTKTAVCDHGCTTTDTVIAAGSMLVHTYGADGICTMCKVAVDPNYVPTTPAATTAGSVNQILGIEDYGGLWGILLIAAGGVILFAAAAVFAISRKRR